MKRAKKRKDITVWAAGLHSAASDEEEESTPSRPRKSQHEQKLESFAKKRV